MPVPTVQEINDFKTDLDDAESLVNGSEIVPTRLGGNKRSYSNLMSRVATGTITTYSAAATYTEIDEWVTESSIVYRPNPASLPIGPETFDSANWIVVQDFGGVPRLPGITGTGGLLNSSPDADQVYAQAYYGGWAATVAGPIGGAYWHQDGTTGTASTTDLENARVFDASGNGWRLSESPEGVYYVESLGAKKDTDDSSFCVAAQALVDYSGNPSNSSNRIPITIKATPGTYYISKAIYVSALDGLKFKFAGRFATRFIVSATYSTSVPGSFPSDGLTYSNDALFTIARTRVTGRTAPNFIIDDSSGAGAAWNLEIGGFYIDASNYSGGKSFDVIRAPELAVSKVYDIVTLSTQYILHTDDSLGAYSMQFEDIDCNYSVAPFKINRGTTLHFNRFSASRCDRGFDSSTNYTVYNACSVDHAAAGAYCWDLDGVGVTLNGCGCEYPEGGILAIRDRGAEVTINGGFFLGGLVTGDEGHASQESESDFSINDNEMVLVDGGKVTLNRVFLRNKVDSRALSITNITQASKAVVTIVGHNLVTGRTVSLASVSGMTEINGQSSRITVLTADTIQLDTIDSSTYTAYTSGGTLTWDGHMNCTIKNGGRVTMLGNPGEDNNTYVQPFEWRITGFGAGGNKDLSRLDWVGEHPSFEIYLTGDETIARNGTTQIVFTSVAADHDLGPSYFNLAHGIQPRTGTPVTHFIAPCAGIYEFCLNGFFTNVDPGDYLFLSVTDKANRVVQLLDAGASNTGVHFSLQDKLFLAAGDKVRIFYRSFSTTVDPVLKAGARFYGGVR